MERCAATAFVATDAGRRDPSPHSRTNQDDGRHQSKGQRRVDFRSRRRATRRADLDRVGSYGFDDVLQRRRCEIGDREIEPAFHLPEGVLGQTYCAGLGDALQSRCDIYAVAHEIAVALLHDVAEVNADPKHDALIVRRPGIAFGHRVLHRDRTSHRFHHAAEFDQRPIAHALEHPAVQTSDNGIDHVGAQRAQSCQRAILVGARHAAKANDVRRKNRSDFAPLGHCAPQADAKLPQKGAGRSSPIGRHASLEMISRS